MLFNKFKLRGIAPKIQQLAKREGEVSVLVREECSLPVVRHAKPTQQLPVISDDEEVQLHAVSYEQPSGMCCPGLVATFAANRIQEEARLGDSGRLD